MALTRLAICLRAVARLLEADGAIETIALKAQRIEDDFHFSVTTRRLMPHTIYEHQNTWRGTPEIVVKEMSPPNDVLIENFHKAGRALARLREFVPDPLVRHSSRTPLSNDEAGSLSRELRECAEIFEANDPTPPESINFAYSDTQNWLTVSEITTFTGANAGVISREATRSKDKDAKEKTFESIGDKTERRIEPISFIRYWHQRYKRLQDEPHKKKRLPPPKTV